LLILCVAGCLRLWLERNARNFEQETEDVICRRIREDYKIWVLAGQRAVRSSLAVVQAVCFRATLADPASENCKKKVMQVTGNRDAVQKSQLAEQKRQSKLHI
jgi:Icc-related predicted phosphoesterase